MRTTRLIIGALIVISTLPLVDRPLGAAEVRIEIAQECNGSTSNTDRVDVSVLVSMRDRAGGVSTRCVVRNSHVSLTVLAAQAYKNKLNAGSVRLEFAPYDQKILTKIINDNVGKKLVLMRKGNIILDFEILRPDFKDGFVINGPDLSDAESIRNAILG